MSNVIKFPTPPYIATLKEQIEIGELDWQQAFDFLQAQGMTARWAKKLLGPSGDELDSSVSIV
tara:strand:- start:678 stop:866 length:189 start_codon:yes stop_codon:yes gene_type:complete